MILIVLLAVLLILIYMKVTKPSDYWITRGVKQQKQTSLGDNLSFLLGRRSIFDMMIDLYAAFPEGRYVGCYQSDVPTLLLRDPELIKLVTVKDFDHFVNHADFMPDGLDPMWSKNLVSLKDNQWRQMRATLSPSFISSKMRIIFNLMSECADEYVEYFKKTNDAKTIELMDIFTRYTNDVIATTAFGVKCDSINEKTNEFYLMGKDASTLASGNNIKFVIYAIAPWLAKIMGMTLFPQHVSDFFRNLVVNTIKTREEKGIVRPDIIHLLLEVRKGKKKIEEQPTIDTGFATVQETIKTDPTKAIEITDTDIAAQTMLFFVAGFDTTAAAMSFMGYELAVNPDIQKRLHEEIDATLKNCGGKLTYEALMKMKYMDMVVSESLRKWPPAIMTDRVCTKSFVIEPVNSNEKPVKIDSGVNVWIPTNAIHRDPNYYQNPEKFDPERFSEENKNNIKPYTYMPFGVGPRNCIGSRFALMAMKTIYFILLRNFDFVVIEKTEIPLRINKTSVGLQPQNGIWVGLKRRETS